MSLSMFLKVWVLRHWRTGFFSSKAKSVLVRLCLIWGVSSTMLMVLGDHVPNPTLAKIVSWGLYSNIAVFCLPFCFFLINRFKYKQIATIDNFFKMMLLPGKALWISLALFAAHPMGAIWGANVCILLYGVLVFPVLWAQKTWSRLLAWPSQFKTWKASEVEKNDLFLKENPKDAAKLLSKSIPTAHQKPINTRL